MNMKPRKYYYALIWEYPKKGESFIVKGIRLTNETEIPKDPKLLYGTSSKDLKRLKVNNYKNKISYDVFTGKQSVYFERDEEEYFIKRDVRLILWEDHEEIDLAWGWHRIVAPDFLEKLAKEQTKKGKCKELDINELIYPEKRLNRNIYKMIEDFA